MARMTFYDLSVGSKIWSDRVRKEELSETKRALWDEKMVKERGCDARKTVSLEPDRAFWKVGASSRSFEVVPSAEGRDLNRESARLIFPTGAPLSRARGALDTDEGRVSTLSLSRPSRRRGASDGEGCASQLSLSIPADLTAESGDACASQVSCSRLSRRPTSSSSLLEASNVDGLASQLSLSSPQRRRCSRTASAVKEGSGGDPRGSQLSMSSPPLRRIRSEVSCMAPSALSRTGPSALMLHAPSALSAVSGVRVSQDGRRPRTGVSTSAPCASRLTVASPARFEI